MLNSMLVKCLALFLGFFGRRRSASALVGVVTALARRLEPMEALRFLFDIDARLYPLQGEMAVAYGGGLHTKHRHMGYHDFFTARIRPDERVLDVGCGVGALANAIATACAAQVTAIDMDAGKIEIAQQRYDKRGLTFVDGNVLNDLPDGHYDVVVLSNVLEHLTDRVDFLKRLLQVAAPQRILIRVPLFERDWRVPLKRELGVEWRLDPTHETEYTMESYSQEISQAGLKLSHLEVRWGEIWSEVTVADG